MAHVEGKKNAYRFMVWQTAGKEHLKDLDVKRNEPEINMD